MDVIVQENTVLVSVASPGPQGPAGLDGVVDVSLVTTLSGYVNNNFVDRTNNQYITGEKSFINQISGDILKINYFLMKDYNNNSYRQVYLSGNNIYIT